MAVMVWSNNYCSVKAGHTACNHILTVVSDSFRSDRNPSTYAPNYRQTKRLPMKKIINLVCACVIAMVAPSVQASQLCDALRDYSYSAMVSRQANVPLHEATYAIIDKRYELQAERMMLNILFSAYDYPVHVTFEEKSSTAYKFATITYGLCAKAQTPAKTNL